jgi:hypothetical protein
MTKPRPPVSTLLFVDLLLGASIITAGIVAFALFFMWSGLR